MTTSRRLRAHEARQNKPLFSRSPTPGKRALEKLFEWGNARRLRPYKDNPATNRNTYERPSWSFARHQRCPRSAQNFTRKMLFAHFRWASFPFPKALSQLQESLLPGNERRPWGEASFRVFHRRGDHPSLQEKLSRSHFLSNIVTGPGSLPSDPMPPGLAL